ARRPSVPTDATNRGSGRPGAMPISATTASAHKRVMERPGGRASQMARPSPGAMRLARKVANGTNRTAAAISTASTSPRRLAFRQPSPRMAPIVSGAGTAISALEEPVPAQEILGNRRSRFAADLHPAIELLQGFEVEAFEDRLQEVANLRIGLED